MTTNSMLTIHGGTHSQIFKGSSFPLIHFKLCIFFIFHTFDHLNWVTSHQDAPSRTERHRIVHSSPETVHLSMQMDGILEMLVYQIYPNSFISSHRVRKHAIWTISKTDHRGGLCQIVRVATTPPEHQHHRRNYTRDLICK